MPRVADHAQRRRQVVEATTRVMAAQGMDGPTVAEVAAEAGVSVGLVQRYFRTKDDMLLMTFEHHVADLMDRLNASWESGGSIKERLRRCLLEFLPLDGPRTAEVRVYLAFCGHAVSSEPLRRVQAAASAMARASLENAIAEARELGEVPVDRDPATEAMAIWVLVDGLTMQTYADPRTMTEAAAERLIDLHLDRVFS
ncbi:TetR/AcrR family transcriptional regulator [Pseudonocardia sp. TRM90224]|uniref:TetR/AcrR family transcriptional regulator n=1 Tax=Pseudonocardia sp. TRM90224 TaxID=2812678 RepID=UPI001E56D178|nr:TetR/AcrR family transcriptional regulator [Pseudonocardia sp. TRM90224]